MDAPTLPISPAGRSDLTHHLHPYTQLRQLEREGPLVIVRGDGVQVFDENGNGYIEGMAGLWCASLGFSERRLCDAAYRQMTALPYYHSFSGKVPGPVAELVETLIRWAPVPMARVLFANSGSEANDTAFKLVRYYNNARGRPLKKKIIARNKGYHGVTMAAASLSGLPMMHQHFDLPLPDVVRVSCPHFYQFGLPGETEAQFVDRLAQELEDTIQREGPETVAAFIAEPATRSTRRWPMPAPPSGCSATATPTAGTRWPAPSRWKRCASTRTTGSSTTCARWRRGCRTGCASSRRTRWWGRRAGWG